MAHHLIKVRLHWDKPDVAKIKKEKKVPIVVAPDKPSGATATLCVDWDTGQWMARENWKALREFLPGNQYAGYFDKSLARGADVPLLGNMGNEPVLLLSNFDLSGSAPAMKGLAHYGTHPQMPIMHAMYTYWWRILDASIMTPYDRMAEMLNMACTDPKLKKDLRQQLGALASPMILLPMAGIFLVFAGAEFLGGAALVYAVKGILGIGQLATDYVQYESSIKALHDIVMGSKTSVSDLQYGAGLLTELLVRLASDIMAALGIKALSDAVSKLGRLFANHAPETWRAKAKKMKTESHEAVKRRIGSRYGYAGEEHLKSPSNLQFTESELKAHADFAAERQKIVILREGKANRMPIMKSQVWIDGKPQWLKAKSSDGWHGLLCVTKKSGIESKALKRTGSYNMGNLKGISPEMDAFIAKNPTRPMYEMPTDGREISGIDYSGAGAKRVEMQGHYAVDMGDRYMIVNKTKGPYAGDNDIGGIYDPKAPKSGQFADRKNSKGQPLANPEDNLEIEYDINQRIWEIDKVHTNRAYNSAQHGGQYGSMGHGHIQSERGAKKFWKPYDEKTGAWEKERLVIWLPTKNRLGQKQSHMFVINSWQELKTFWEANHYLWPSGWKQ